MLITPYTPSDIAQSPQCGAIAPVLTDQSPQRLRSQDLDAIQAFTSQLLNVFYGPGFFMQFILTKDYVCLLVRQPGESGRGAIVATASGKLVNRADGTAEGHLYTLAVATEHRRRGLGSKMVVDFEEEMRRAARGHGNGLSALYLETKLSNHEAISFYEALGFARDDVKQGYYDGQDGVRMVRLCPQDCF